eukprot:Opistho-2@92568
MTRVIPSIKAGSTTSTSNAQPSDTWALLLQNASWPTSLSNQIEVSEELRNQLVHPYALVAFFLATGGAPRGMGGTFKAMNDDSASRVPIGDVCGPHKLWTLVEHRVYGPVLKLMLEEVEAASVTAGKKVEDVWGWMQPIQLERLETMRTSIADNKYDAATYLNPAEAARIVLDLKTLHRAADAGALTYLESSDKRVVRFTSPLLVAMLKHGEADHGGWFTPFRRVCLALPILRSRH